MGFICLPCQVGGKEYKGYGETPFQGNEAVRTDVRETLVMQNDYAHAKKNKGMELGTFVTFKEHAKGNVHKIYEQAISLKDFVKSKDKNDGDLLLMNFQLENKKDGRKRFYIAQFPFKNFSVKRFEVPGITGVCGGLSWSGIKPCEVKVDYNRDTINFKSKALEMQNVPMMAVWVLPKSQLKF